MVEMIYCFGFFYNALIYQFERTVTNLKPSLYILALSHRLFCKYTIIKYLNYEMKTYNNVVIGICSSSQFTSYPCSSHREGCGRTTVTESNVIKMMVSNFKKVSIISKADPAQLPRTQERTNRRSYYAM